MRTQRVRVYSALLTLCLLAFAHRGHAQLLCPVPDQAASLFDKYKSAVFKVIGLGEAIGIKEKEIPLGTATLFHSAGYFLTAAHIFDDNGALKEYGKTYKRGMKVKLRKREGRLGREIDVDVEGELYRIRGSTSEPDLAMIKASLKSWSDYPDVFVGRVRDYNGQWIPIVHAVKGEIVGYPLDGDLVQSFGLHHLNSSQIEGIEETAKRRELVVRPPEDPAELRAVSNDVFLNGLSGSLVISSDGYGWGVLNGKPRKVYAAGATGLEYRFTPSAYLPDEWLMALPLTRDGNEFVRMVKKGALTEDQRHEVENMLLTSVDLMHIVHEFQTRPKLYPGLQDFEEDELVQRCLCASLNRLVQLSKDKASHARYALQGAREIASLGKQMSEEGYAEGGRAAFVNAREFFAFAEGSSHFSLANESPAKAYFDYGAALKAMAGAYPELGVSLEDATKRFDQAIQFNPSYVRPYLGKAQIANAEGRYGDAKAVTIEALRENKDPSWDNRLIGTIKSMNTKMGLPPYIGVSEAMNRIDRSAVGCIRTGC